MSQAEHSPVSALRQFLRSGLEAPHRDLPELLVRAAAPAQADGSPGAAARAGECVFLMGAILHTERDTAQTARLFQALISAGRLGRALVALHIQSRPMPLPQFTPLLLVLPDRDVLALTNDMLQDCPADDKQLAAWIRTLLPAPGRLDMREALLFLKALAEKGAPLARPLRDALLDAGLGDAVARAFAGTPGAAALEALLQAARLLNAPAVQSEALAHALRTAGAEGPSRLHPLLAAPPDLPPRDAALGAEIRRLALLPAAGERLLPAARTEPELLGLVLADLLNSGEVFAAAALRLVPLLPRQGVLACLAELPEKAQAAVRARLLQALAVLEPELLRRAAKTLGPAQGAEDPALQALAGLLAARPAPDASSPWNTTAWPDASTPGGHPLGPDAAPPKAAQNRRTSLAQATAEAMTAIRDQDFSHSTLADQTLEGLVFGDADLSRCRFSNVTFRRVRLSAVLLSRCVFENCVFQACAFSGADLCQGSFAACRFDACTFDFCDLSRARFTGCVLNGCALAESSLAGAVLARSRLDACSLRTCTLAGARFWECALAHLSLTRTALTSCLWERCVWRSSELLACALGAARILGSECLELRLTRCAAARLVVLGGHTENPHLAQAGRAARMDCLECASPEPGRLPAGLETAGGAALVRSCVERWLRVDEARQTLAAMRGQDQRRRELACERLGGEQAQFLTLLPALLVTDVFERAQGIPACALGGHARPGRPTRENLGPEAQALLERYFPGQAPPGGDQPPPVLLLEAVYAIGSLGSVAQKPSSDVDCWVCLNPGPDAAPDAVQAARAGLGRKLAALEAWTWQQFGLETHFFPMSLDEVRQNQFGMSDRESSGSAQAALLKEEFYRTALKLAGRDLLWWAAPPSASQAEAEVLLGELARLAPRTAAELADLGQPSPIPPEEYFGACLWQIVKALHSPYKSVMKLGLLEKYAGQGRDMRLLCDRIKEAALRGRTQAQDLDPYLSLFTAIRKHYRALGDATSLLLIGECLRLKAEVAPEDLPEEFGSAAEVPPSALGPELGAFAGALRLGGMVSLFMTQAYRRIQEGLSADQGAAHISPEDLTRLGRRIVANFAQQPHKVGLVPFLSEDTAFTELFFYAEKAPGKRTIWAVKGKDKTAGKAAVESLAPLRRDTDVVRLLAWLLFNGLYDPRQAVQAERSLAPIALADLQSLLADLAAFFPRRATLEPDLDEYLKPERVVRAYVIGNLPVASDKSKLLAVSVLYATNWGEVFCQSFENPSLTLQKSCLAFLREVLDKPLPQNIEIRAFTPKKSACPKLRPG